MNILKSNFLERQPIKKTPINIAYNWACSLMTDATKDFIYVVEDSDGLKLNIEISVMINDVITAILLFYVKNGDEIRVPLFCTKEERQDIWKVNLIIEDIKMLQPFSYRFKIICGEETFFYDSIDLHKYKVSNRDNFKFYYKNPSPNWLKSTVIYHIFIDRFQKNLPNKSHEKSWTSVPSDDMQEFFGGDIRGIIEKLEYLKNLGINLICLTPIFQSSTNHKYDVEDYFVIDKEIGGDDDFIHLITECKKNNIKIILDGVFNHVSGRSRWFNKDALYAEAGAFQDRNSYYIDFFNFEMHPDKYDAFWGDKYLPKLNYRSQELRNIVYKSDKSIVKFWMQEPYEIDGWRLDACCMLGKYNDLDLNSEVLAELYTEAKISNGESYIFGEHPFDPSDIEPYKHMDGITNYSGFYSPLLYWLDNKINFEASDLDKALKEFRALVGFQFAQSSKNFIGNHDKKRLYSILGGNEDKYFTALSFLFTYVGVPSIYYGEEIGLHDLDISDDSRICMKWSSLNSSNKKILKYTKELIDLYKSSKAIQNGTFKTLYAEDNFFIYERFFEDELILVFLNNSEKILSSITIETSSLRRLAIEKMYSYLDASLDVSVFDRNFIEIKNIINKSPIILSSYQK